MGNFNKLLVIIALCGAAACGSVDSQAIPDAGDLAPGTGGGAPVAAAGGAAGSAQLGTGGQPIAGAPGSGGGPARTGGTSGDATGGASGGATGGQPGGAGAGGGAGGGAGAPQTCPAVCPTNETCARTVGGAYQQIGSCRSVNGRPCAAAADCASGYCLNGACSFQPCAKDADCSYGQSCMQNAASYPYSAPCAAGAGSCLCG